ncbi:transcriptional regulator [Methylobacterium sp. Leaf465]|uniref:TetR/AcrR family transcriptional regulator n=1 Tax=Methylobacterium sp. Leaf465 TaxID=1736385 RepID=UPI0006FDCB60|nr:TetR/AcrR family transcriptional regulator [Methylobacterium sp. Leaf465]KQT82905.1 transcriptional regulator [Methylobacterium sp. Leaf465]
MKADNKEAILAAAKRTAMAHGYAGLNFRDLAAEVGIKAASVYYHFPGKAELGVAVAKRYWEDIAADLDAISNQASDPLASLHRYPEIFRTSLQNDNRMCLSSFMTAEYDDLPDVVKHEVRAFAEVNVAWLSDALTAAGVVEAVDSDGRAGAIYAAVAGAQLMARGRADLSLFDTLIDHYRATGLLPA